jgi:hypothetical protein
MAGIVPDLQGFSEERKTEDMFVKPAFVAATGGALSKFVFFPDKTEFNIAGRAMGFHWVMMVALYLASMASTAITDRVVPQVSREDQVRKPVSFAILEGTAAGATLGAAALANTKAPGELGYFKLGGLGALAEVIGSVVYYDVFAPMVYKGR